MHINLRKYARDIRSALKRDSFNIDGGDFILFGDGLRLSGEFFEGIGADLRIHRNLVVDQGVINMFNIMFGSTSKITNWYVAPFSGSASPANTWTAANVTSNSTEITATSPEGFSETTRQAITFTNATSLDQIDNYSSKAAYTTVTASSLTVTGLFAVSLSTRGGTTGVLYSATKFAVATVLNNGAVWTVGYRAVGTPT